MALDLCKICIVDRQSPSVDVFYWLFSFDSSLFCESLFYFTFLFLNIFLAVVSTLKYNKINSPIEQVNKIGNLKMKMRFSWSMCVCVCVCIGFEIFFAAYWNIHENIWYTQLNLLDKIIKIRMMNRLVPKYNFQTFCSSSIRHENKCS